MLQAKITSKNRFWLIGLAVVGTIIYGANQCSSAGQTGSLTDEPLEVQMASANEHRRVDANWPTVGRFRFLLNSIHDNVEGVEMDRIANHILFAHEEIRKNLGKEIITVLDVTEVLNIWITTMVRGMGPRIKENDLNGYVARTIVECSDKPSDCMASH